jgi:hypothetical protein
VLPNGDILLRKQMDSLDLKGLHSALSINKGIISRHAIDLPPKENSTTLHELSNGQKSLGGSQFTSKSEVDEDALRLSPQQQSTAALFTSERSNMDYYNLPGICKRTGATEDQLVVWAIQQAVDNAIDFNESNYDEEIHAINTDGCSGPFKFKMPTIDIETKYDPNKNQFIIIVRNPNFGRRHLGFTEERVHSIFEDLDQFLSSKRNLFKLNRGLQGDALKEEEGIPTALASKYNKGKAWNEPLIIRNGFG